MTPLILTLVVLVLLVLIGELVLWRLFRRHADPVNFPHESDHSQVGFFRMGRMRALAIIHTVILGGWIIFSVLWLW